MDLTDFAYLTQCNVCYSIKVYLVFSTIYKTVIIGMLETEKNKKISIHSHSNWLIVAIMCDVEGP